VLREGLVARLNQEADITVVAQCAPDSPALRAILDTGAEFVLLDYGARDLRHTDALKALREAGFTGASVILADGLDEDEVFVLVCLGVSGVISTKCRMELLLKCIRKVGAGELWFDQPQVRGIVRKSVELANGNRKSRLSPRETEVLKSLLDGLTNKEIAARLGTTESAVKGVFQQLFRKAGTRSRSRLVRVALERYRSDLQIPA